MSQPRSSRLRRSARGVRDALRGAREAISNRMFNSRVLARALGRQHVLCLGDSHVAVMAHVSVAKVWFRELALAGATASGILNPQAASGSQETFATRLAAARPWQHVLLQLGEVDCGFLIWRRAQVRGLSVEEQLAFTIDSYATFIAGVVAMGFRSVSVLSVALPTIGDDPARWGEIANLRRTVTATMAQRTALTLRFNELLRERCPGLGAAFIDATSGHLDRATGLIDERFVRASHQDHHLDDAPYAALIAQQLHGVFH